MAKIQPKNSAEELLYSKVPELITLARRQVVVRVNTTMVNTYFEIGRLIVEEEQQEKERAAYGKAVLKALAHRLTQKFGKGFSTENLDRMRFFYKVYTAQIYKKSHPVKQKKEAICILCRQHHDLTNSVSPGRIISS